MNRNIRMRGWLQRDSNELPPLGIVSLNVLKKLVRGSISADHQEYYRAQLRNAWAEPRLAENLPATRSGWDRTWSVKDASIDALRPLREFSIFHYAKVFCQVSLRIYVERLLAGFPADDGIARFDSPFPHALAETSWLRSGFAPDPYNWYARQLGGSFCVSFQGRPSSLWVSVTWA